MAPKKILVIKLRSLGDTVILTAPLSELTRIYPSSEIHVLVTHCWSSVISRVPGITKIWKYERRPQKMARARSMARLSYLLSKEKFDCVINFHASPSSAALAWTTRAPIRSIHFHGYKDSNRYSTVTIPGKGLQKPIIERDMDALRALGLHIPAGRLPSIELQAKELRQADEYLQHLSLTGSILGLGLGATRPTKSWPIERFASLAIDWCIKRNGAVLAISGPDEDHTVKEFLTLVDQLLDASGLDIAKRSQVRAQIHATQNITLEKLPAIQSRLAVWVGNDSGPKHLAVAVKTPTVTLFGPENPFEWHPYPRSRHPYLFIENLPCRTEGIDPMPKWCSLHTCTIEEHKCMRMIGTQAVFDLCEKVDASTVPSDENSNQSKILGSQ